MSIIGETILSFSIEFLLQKLTSEAVRLYGRQGRIHADLMKWKQNLLMINAVLDDAEEKRTKEQSVKIWLGELQNLAYDAEDVLEEFETEAFRRNLLREARPSKSKFHRLIPTCCTNLTPRSFKFDSMLESQIKEITTRLQDIATQKDQLNLKENSGGRSKKDRERPPTTSLVDKDEVFGREKDKQAIIELLLRDDSGVGGGFSVIPIIGMGGSGKTTLAQLVYNDDRICKHFNVRVWTCVSEDFNSIRITRTILSSVPAEFKADDDLNKLQEKLKRELAGKKFLFVLDDIWNENYNDWNLLSRPFKTGAPGSKIIVTTRNQGVASMMGTVPAYELKELSKEDCRCVFSQHSLGTRDFGIHQHLKETGEKIVMKCDGLPLAAKTLGGLLRGKYDVRDWEEVCNSKIWDLSEEKCDVIPSLRLSYHYLSPHLKRCFTYCSLFPKDYEFGEMEVILLWMAEGFLQHENDENQMEDLGSKTFRELHSRSFFQRSSNNTSLFVMHDLINDLAQWAAGDTYFRMEDSLEVYQRQKFSKNLRHLSYICRKYDGIKRFEAVTGAENLRTFLPIGLPHEERYLANSVVHMLLKQRRLRVLSLCGYRIWELPNSIRELKHLHYLNLSGTQIQVLPESVNTLHNLHTLLLENCRRLKRMCADMGNLIKLHHLNNSGVDLLEEMPLGIAKLTCLQTLNNFVVGKSTDSGLRELKCLKNLRGTLNISRLENVKGVGEGREAEIEGKRNLKELNLKWSEGGGNLREPENETRLLGMLKPHQNLEKLTIQGYGGTRFPSWLEDSLLSNLVFLRIEGCGMCTSLPSVGQLPVLKNLLISGVVGVKRVGSDFHGNGCPVPFPSLQTLRFWNLQEWEDWIPYESGGGVDIYPRLQELSIQRCPKLQGKLPERLPSLRSLVISGCEQLQVVVPSLPTLRTLKIGACKKVECRSPIDLSSPNSVSVQDISDRAFLVGLFKQRLPNLEALEFNSCRELTYIWQSGAELMLDISSLHQLKITECPQLRSLEATEEQDQQCEGLPCRLQYLKLIDCKGLLKLPQALLSLSSLGEIDFHHLDSLVSFPEAALPSQLRKIGIHGCNALKCLPEAWMSNSNTSLEILEISMCNSLTYIAKVQLPTNLRQFKITLCENLRALTDEDQISEMEEVGIHSGSSKYASSPSASYSFSKLGLPATLEDIHIVFCQQLEYIAKELDNNASLESIWILNCGIKFLPNNLCDARQLQRIFLSGCPYLASFPERGLPSTKLTKLRITRCRKLKALPKGIHKLNSLQELTLGGCPSIVSLSEDDIPANICTLEIYDDVKICKRLFEWGFRRFNSLRQLTISGGPSDVVSFPQEEIGMTLPVSVSHLEIEGFPSLERLSSLARNLPSLEVLRLSKCPKLRNLKEEDLPLSLLSLYVSECPLIEEMCKTDLADRIPCISINNRWAFQPST